MAEEDAVVLFAALFTVHPALNSFSFESFVGYALKGRISATECMLLNFAASPRTLILAKPAVRPAGMETDLREDAFTVSPAALKARCSRRLKKLARPKNYKHRR